MQEKRLEQLTKALPDIFKLTNLQERGIRPGDQILFKALGSKQETVRLRRTQLDFVSAMGFPRGPLGCFFMLPDLTDQRYRYSLQLIRHTNPQQARFLFVAHSSFPFKINDNYSFASFVERGDVISLGHNRLEFRAPPKRESQQALMIDPKVSQSEALIVLEGETGTGKSRLAQKIHRKSGRSGPFIQVNISSLAENLVESELFGHIKGAFTGATYAKLGVFRQASEGTLFLDEIDSLPLSMQVKLLLFLDSMKVRPVGAQQEYPCSARLIVASGQGLKDLVKKGKMREDFYYRLNAGFAYTLPSLKHNPDLIKTVCFQLMDELQVHLPTSLIEFYQKLSWPGNIRQLKSHLSRKTVLSSSQKLEFDGSDQDLLELQLAPATQQDWQSLEEVKALYTTQVYYRLREDKQKTCHVLKISPPSLRSLLKKSYLLQSQEKNAQSIDQ